MVERYRTRAPRGAAAPFLLLFGLLAPLLIVAAPAARAELEAGGAGFYRFTTEVAPLDLSGTFPLTVDAGDGPLAGTLTMAVDAGGRITGTVVLDGATLAASGKVRQSARSSSIAVKATGEAGKLTLKGKLEGSSFTGKSAGKGSVAKGHGTFALDVSSAGPLLAEVEFLFGAKGKKKLKGTGTALIRGEEVPLTGRGRGGATLVLKLKGPGFKWKASGSGFTSGLFLSFQSKGYGAKHSGEGLTVELLEPPVDLAYPSKRVEFEARVGTEALSPTVAGGDVERFSVSPGLPGGLSLNSRTGRITGTPAEPAPEVEYTVRAENPAGEATTVLELSVRTNRADSLAPQSGPLSDEDIRHLLARTSFGTTADAFDSVKKKGLSTFVDGMLTLARGTKVEGDADALLVNDDDPKGLKGGFPNQTQLVRWWLYLMLENKNPFQEVLAFFWHDHFAASSDVLASDRRYWMKKQIDLWRHEGDGNLRDLLVAMARDWAMLQWLDGLSSTRRAPNENFPREFWELFTLGVDNGYTQEDILEAARAFTGYRDRLNEDTGQRYVVFDPDRHDAGDKSFFGRTIVGQNDHDDYEAVVDITLEERPVAEFLCRKLFEFFAYRDAPDEIIDELAATLRDSGYELRPVLRKIFTSEAFFSDRAKADRAKGPVEFAVGFIRTTGLEIDLTKLRNHLRDQGQEPTRPPVVDGWPEDEMWLSAQQMIERTNLVRSCIYDRKRQAELGIDVADIMPPPAERTAEATVDHLATLLRVELSPADRNDLVEYLNTKRNSDGSTVSSPFDGNDPVHIDERVRGLLYILAQHPGYHAR